MRLRRPAIDTLPSIVTRRHDGWRRMMTVTTIGAALCLAACSGNKDQPGAVSADEARQLNEAAAMLDANSVDLNAVADDADATNANSIHESAPR